MIHAHDFCDSKDNQPFPFGASKEAVAAGLRKLADSIESEEVLVQSIIINASINADNFTSTRVIFNLNEKKVKP